MLRIRTLACDRAAALPMLIHNSPVGAVSVVDSGASASAMAASSEVIATASSPDASASTACAGDAAGAVPEATAAGSIWNGSKSGASPLGRVNAKYSSSAASGINASIANFHARGRDVAPAHDWFAGTGAMRGTVVADELDVDPEGV